MSLPSELRLAPTSQSTKNSQIKQVVKMSLLKKPFPEEDAATSSMAEVGWEGFNFSDACWDLEDGELDEKLWQYLRKSFESLLNTI